MGQHSKKQRLAIYRRTLKVLEAFVADDTIKSSLDKTLVEFKINQHKIYKATLGFGLGLCFVMDRVGGNLTYFSQGYKTNYPELYKVGKKHKCKFNDSYWFRFEGKNIC